MRRKLTLGWIMFIAGIILDVISDISDIWMIGVLAGVLWPIGMVIGVNALIYLKQEKKTKTEDDSVS